MKVESRNSGKPFGDGILIFLKVLQRHTKFGILAAGIIPKVTNKGHFGINPKATLNLPREDGAMHAPL